MSCSVLITGTSSGFGFNAAVDLARMGWRVFAAMRDVGRAGPLLEAAGDQRDRIEPVQLDVTHPSSVTSAVEAVLERTQGRLDALLSNAGYGLMGAFEDLEESACRRQMEVNFFGTLAVTRAVLPAMRLAERGRIAIVTSNAVNAPHPMLTLYAASKWALEGWAEGLTMEVAPFGIKVVVVQPGAHRTPFAEHVEPVVPANSPYAEWLAAASPGISNLDKWGRDPDRARAALVSAVTDEDVPFRMSLGEDTSVFAALKAALPYEARTLLMRALVGLPGPGDFTTAGRIRDEPPTPIAETLAAALARDPALFDQAASLLASRGKT